jgi:hypothetical protein
VRYIFPGLEIEAEKVDGHSGRARFALLLCVAVVACGKAEHGGPQTLEPSASNTDADPPFRSGQRLRARVLDDGEGTLAFVEWHDSELDAACVFRAAADGVVRCLPWLRDPLSGYSGSDIVYTDAECIHPALELDAAVLPPVYTHDDSALRATCSERRYPVRRVGNVVVGDGRIYFRTSVSGECLGVGAGLPSGRVLYALGEEVPPDTFQSAERVVSESGERLRAVELHGDDGSFQREGVWDAERDEACSRWALTGELCVPGVTGTADYFVDDACTLLTAQAVEDTVADGSTCPAVELAAQEGAADGCGHYGKPRLFEPGTLVQAAPAFMLDGASCGSVEGTSSYYQVAAELPDDTFAVVRAASVGSGRLRVEGAVGPDGTRLDVADGSVRLSDERLGTACSPATACTGELLCEPVDHAGGFADSSCIDPVFEASANSDCASDVPGSIATPRAAEGCWDGQLLEVKKELAGVSYFTQVENSCSVGAHVPRGFTLRHTTPSASTPIRLLDRIE